MVLVVVVQCYRLAWVASGSIGLNKALPVMLIMIMIIITMMMMMMMMMVIM